MNVLIKLIFVPSCEVQVIRSHLGRGFCMGLSEIFIGNSDKFYSNFFPFTKYSWMVDEFM